jgi:Dockerin type I domain
MKWKILLIGLLCVLAGKPVVAVPVATDDASNPAYALEAGGAWKGLQPSLNENPPGTDNGGYGFLPWNFEGGYHDPAVSPYGNLNHFIDGIDFSQSTFNNLSSPAFGLTNANIANFGFTARATRVFSQPLAVGGSFSVQFDNPTLAPLKNNDDTGYIIRLNSGGGAKLPGNPNVYERLGFFAFHGFHQGRWNRTDATGVNDTGLLSTVTTSGAVFRVTLQTAESYLMEILPLGGGSPLYAASGNLASTGFGNIDTLEILMFGNGSGNGLTGASGLPTGQREFFFNSLLLDNPFLAGDYNRDGTVDAADYVVWRRTLNQTVANGSGADGNWDGVITGQDYDIWRQNLGGTAAATGTNNGFIQVPEPGTIPALFIAIYFVRVRRIHT